MGLYDISKKERHRRVKRLVKNYRAAVGSDDDYILCDLLADLRHWADMEGYDYDAEDTRAMDHYEAENSENECWEERA